MAYSVKQARLFSGMTQDEIAKKMGINRSTYIKLEKNPGSMTIEQGVEFSHITGVDFNDIVFLP